MPLHDQMNRESRNASTNTTQAKRNKNNRITIKKTKPYRNTKEQGYIQSRNKIKRLLDRTRENECQMEMLPSDIESEMFVYIFSSLLGESGENLQHRGKVLCIPRHL